MPICIECRYPVSQLYHVLQSRNQKTAPPSTTPSHKASISSLSSVPSSQKLSPASQRGLPPGGEAKRAVTGSSDVRLTQCPRCKRFADKYVEHDYVVLFIDLVLVKPQVGSFTLNPQLMALWKQVLITIYRCTDISSSTDSLTMHEISTLQSAVSVSCSYSSTSI